MISPLVSKYWLFYTFLAKASYIRSKVIAFKMGYASWMGLSSENRSCATFSRDIDGSPVVIVCGQPSAEERAQFTHAVSFVLPYHAQENGLPVGGELQRVGKIEDALERALGAGAIWIGHVTGLARQRVFFYSSTPVNGPIEVKVGLFKKESFVPDCRHDPDWTLFNSELEPLATELEDSQNMGVVRALKEAGDDVTLPRVVDFAAWFHSAAKRSEFVEAMKAEGYSFGEKAFWEPDGQFWCEFQN